MILVRRFLYVVFFVQVGLLLIVMPWWPAFWESNYFSSIVTEWHQYWDNMYVRGAVSGLGVVNLYISFVEMFRLRRFSKQ